MDITAILSGHPYSLAEKDVPYTIIERQACTIQIFSQAFTRSAHARIKVTTLTAIVLTVLLQQRCPQHVLFRVIVVVTFSFSMLNVAVVVKSNKTM